MKAIVYEKYGSPDELRLTEVTKPTPADDEVLVKVHAVGLNAADWHMMRADPFLVRFSEGLFKPKNTILGEDIAGTVEAVGKAITQFSPGDAVFTCYARGLAEYVCIPDRKLVPKPDNLSFEEAAAVPMAALTALQGLRDMGKIQSGHKVMIHGASGGVGTFAVQIAKHFGAEVTAVCSTSKVAMVRALGADHVIDYTREDFSKNGQQYDLILAANGNRSLSDYERALTPPGIYVMAGGATSQMFQAILLGRFKTKQGGKSMRFFLASSNPADLALVKELIESGKIKPVMDRCYPLSQTAEAMRYLEAGHAKGKDRHHSRCMKAIVYTRYGPPDVLQLQDIEKPTPKDDELLISIHAASVNRSDWECLIGKPLYARFGGLFKPGRQILGSDIAGRVEVAGKDNAHFKVGDEVFGDILAHMGGFAEYVCVRGTAMALKPAGMRFEEASAIPQAAVIALQGIRDKGQVQPGQHVLINGAGGGAGVFAIQLAKRYGAEVTAVDNAGKMDFLRALGADHVIDYAREDFTKNGKQYDVILDLVAHRSAFAYLRALKPDGRYYFVGGSVATLFQILLLGPLMRRIAGKHVRLLAVQPNRKDLEHIAALCESGEIAIAIDRRFPLNEVPQALRYLGEGRAKGKVVVVVKEAI